MRRPLQMLSFLLAASVVAALNAPASLVADCAEPASAYAIRACAAERLNLAHKLRACPGRASLLFSVAQLGAPDAFDEAGLRRATRAPRVRSTGPRVAIIQRQLRACGRFPPVSLKSRSTRGHKINHSLRNNSRTPFPCRSASTPRRSRRRRGRRSTTWAGVRLRPRRPSSSRAVESRAARVGSRAARAAVSA